MAYISSLKTAGNRLVCSLLYKSATLSQVLFKRAAGVCLYSLSHSVTVDKWLTGSAYSPRWSEHKYNLSESSETDLIYMGLPVLSLQVTKSWGMRLSYGVNIDSVNQWLGSTVAPVCLSIYSLLPCRLNTPSVARGREARKRRSTVLKWGKRVWKS